MPCFVQGGWPTFGKLFKSLSPLHQITQCCCGFHHRCQAVTELHGLKDEPQYYQPGCGFAASGLGVREPQHVDIVVIRELLGQLADQVRMNGEAIAKVRQTLIQVTAHSTLVQQATSWETRNLLPFCEFVAEVCWYVLDARHVSSAVDGCVKKQLRRQSI